jgi:hypothetical protein
MASKRTAVIKAHARREYMRQDMAHRRAIVVAALAYYNATQDCIEFNTNAYEHVLEEDAQEQLHIATKRYKRLLKKGP